MCLHFRHSDERAIFHGKNHAQVRFYGDRTLGGGGLCVHSVRNRILSLRLLLLVSALKSFAMHLPSCVPLLVREMGIAWIWIYVLQITFTSYQENSI